MPVDGSCCSSCADRQFRCVCLFVVVVVVVVVLKAVVSGQP